MEKQGAITTSNGTSACLSREFTLLSPLNESVHADNQIRRMSAVLRNDFALVVELDPALIGHQLDDFFRGCVCGLGYIVIERLPAVGHNRRGSDSCWVKAGRSRNRGSNVLS